MQLKIKVLKKGDSVINVFPYGSGFAVSVKRKGGGVDVILVDKNDEGIPEVVQMISICEGNGEVQLGGEDVTITTL